MTITITIVIIIIIIIIMIIMIIIMIIITIVKPRGFEIFGLTYHNMSHGQIGVFSLGWQPIL